MSGRLHTRCIAGVDASHSIHMEFQPAPTHFSCLRSAASCERALSRRGSTAPRQKNATHRGNVNVARHYTALSLPNRSGA
jgi:hypothetical protein